MRSNDPYASFLIDVLMKYTCQNSRTRKREREREKGGRGRKEGNCVLTPRQPWPVILGRRGRGGGRGRERERGRERGGGRERIASLQSVTQIAKAM